MRGLNGRKVIVTGGGSGIGRVVCIRFAEEGSEVAVFDLNEGGARQTVRTIKMLAARRMDTPSTSPTARAWTPPWPITRQADRSMFL